MNKAMKMCSIIDQWSEDNVLPKDNENDNVIPTTSCPNTVITTNNNTSTSNLNNEQSKYTNSCKYK